MILSMVYVSKIISLFFILLSVAYSSALVQVSASASSSVQAPVVQMIAGVALQDCSYNRSTSSVSGLIKIQCNISNKFGAQGDIKYGIQLVRKNGQVTEIIDTKVYDETLSLFNGQTITKSIDYVPPSYLQGDYQLRGVLRTSGGLMLSSIFIGVVQLRALNSQHLNIEKTSCSFVVNSEAPLSIYSAKNTLQANQKDSLEVVCDVSSYANEEIIAIPKVFTYERTVFGDVVAGSKNLKNIQSQIVYSKKESKKINFTLPGDLKPQMYEAVLTLNDTNGRIISNTITIPYLINGEGASIENIILDKSYYKKRDSAEVAVFFKVFSSILEKNTSKNTKDFLVSKESIKKITLFITDKAGNICSEEKRFAVKSGSRSFFEKYKLTIIEECLNPKVTVTIKDESGIVFAQKTISVTSENMSDKSKINNKALFIIFSIFFALGVSFFVIKKYKQRSVFVNNQ
jgi:hypothetical protein